MAASKAVQKTLTYCRKQPGHVAVAVVERWNPVLKRRHDLFGFCDVLWIEAAIMQPSGRIATNHWYIQCTTHKGISDHIAKIRENKVAVELNGLPNVNVCIHAWAKRIQKGKVRWELKVLFPFASNE